MLSPEKWLKTAQLAKKKTNLLKFNSYSAIRGINRADIYCVPALTAAIDAMQAQVRHC